MKNLQEVTERICELKGITAAQDAVLAALVRILPGEARAEWARSFGTAAEVATAILMNADVSDITIDAFGREAGRWQRLLQVQAEAPLALDGPCAPSAVSPPDDSSSSPAASPPGAAPAAARSRPTVPAPAAPGRRTRPAAGWA
jgi:hypothetical protein